MKKVFEVMFKNTEGKAEIEYVVANNSVDAKKLLRLNNPEIKQCIGSFSKEKTEDYREMNKLLICNFLRDNNADDELVNFANEILKPNKNLIVNNVSEEN